jgi:hypothetical protein
MSTPPVWPEPSHRRRALVRDLGRGGAVVGLGVAVAVVSAVPDPSRPVLVLAVLTLAACLAAAALRWRSAGTLAVLAATLTPLLAGALDASGPRPVLTVVTAALLVLLVSALASSEDARSASPGAVTVGRAPWSRLALPPLLALVAGSVVAVTAAQDVVPSVPLVLAGLAAAVTALVIAAGAHRT